MYSSPTSSYWFTLFVYRPTQKITFHNSCIQCFCPCLSFLIILVNIDIIFILWFTWKPIKACNLHTISNIVFIVCIQRGLILTTGWNVPLHSKTAEREIFTWSSSLLQAVVGLTLFDIITLIWGILNFRLHYHQYFYRDIISRWLPTKSRDSPATNFMLEFSSLRKIASQG